MPPSRRRRTRWFAPMGLVVEHRFGDFALISDPVSGLKLELGRSDDLRRALSCCRRRRAGHRGNRSGRSAAAINGKEINRLCDRWRSILRVAVRAQGTRRSWLAEVSRTQQTRRSSVVRTAPDTRVRGGSQPALRRDATVGDRGKQRGVVLDVLLGVGAANWTIASLNVRCLPMYAAIAIASPDRA